jgi:PAS domain S-box-containing protein
MASFVDITERKQMEEALHFERDKLTSILNSMEDGIYIANSQYEVEYVNPVIETQFGPVKGRKCYKYLRDRKEVCPWCPNQAVFAGETVRWEWYSVKNQRTYDLIDTPLKNADGSISKLEIFRDITERKKMEEQLIIADRLASIGELSSGIAHELNNPLTSVIAFSELLLDEKDVPDDIKEDLKIINSEAQRTANIVKNLLTFARKHPTEKESVDINKTIEAVLELRAYEQKVNNIQVDTHFAPDLPEIIANTFDLQQVFLNIIINAEHFMTEAHGRGTITITTERVGDIVRVSFADDGPGITPENLGHVFDPFFTIKEVGKGTGLGLNISHGIITEHGGKICAESELGKGATFVIELPVSKQ